MNDDMAAVGPRRLVVAIHDDGNWDFSRDMVQDGMGDRPQLVHQQRINRVPGPSRLDRIRLRVGLKARPPKTLEGLVWWNIDAIVEGYIFVTGNYRSGDQVILVGEQSRSGDHIMEGMEILARHLYDGTLPGDPPKSHLCGGKNTPGKGIPIYAVAVLGWKGGMESISLINSELKSRFPPRVERIVCYGWSDSDYWSCSTVIDSDGDILSREISMYDKAYLGVTRLSETTRDIIYYKPGYVPNWDQQEPVWIKVLHSLPNGIPRNLPLSALPAGMHRHELRRYQGGSRHSDRLVWKSFRH